MDVEKNVKADATANFWKVLSRAGACFGCCW